MGSVSPTSDIASRADTDTRQVIDRYRTYRQACGDSANTVELRVTQARLIMRELPQLAAVTPEDLAGLLERRYADRRPETRNSAVGAFQTFFRWALAAGLIAADPSKGLERIRKPRDESRVVERRRSAPAGYFQSAGREEDDPLMGLFRRHLESRRRSACTIRARLGYLRQLVAAIGDLKAATPARLDAFVESRESSWAPETVNSCVSSLRAFYKWAHEREHLPTNPAAYLETVQIVPRPAPIATDEQVHEGLHLAASVAERAMIRLARECGLRRAEIATLHTSQRTGDWLLVVGKGQKSTRKHLEPELLALLEEIEQRQGAGYYFRNRTSASPDAPVRADYVYDTIKRLTGVNPHALRHAAATTLYTATKDIRLTQEFLGHSSIRTTQGYVHVTDADLSLASAAVRLRS